MNRQQATLAEPQPKHLPCLLLNKLDVQPRDSKPVAKQASCSLLLNKVLSKPAAKPCDDILIDCVSSAVEPEPSECSSKTHLVTTQSMFQNVEYASDSDAESTETACTRQTESGSSVCDSSTEVTSSITSSREPDRGCAEENGSHLMIVHTMEHKPSKALQIVIENAELVDLFYRFDKKTLGKGSLGVIKKATMKASGAVRAVKCISQESVKENIDVIKKEIEIMKLVDHPNCLMMYEIFEDSRQLHLVLQMCSGGHLQHYITKNGCLSELQLGVVMQQVLGAVRYLHSQRICHRDVKAEHCLLQTKERIKNCTVKLADFGKAGRLAPGECFKDAAGTLSHMAPEVLARRYSFSCDLWSCGVMSYYLLCGYLPFDGNARSIIKNKISNQNVRFETIEWIDVSQIALNFISQLLTKNPEIRCSADQALSNDWLFNIVPKAEGVRLPPKVFGMVTKFRKLSQLQRAVLKVMASMLPDSEIEAARKFFIMTDANCDGMVTLSEICQALRTDKATQSCASEEDLAYTISYTDFLAATMDLQKHIRTPLLKATFGSVDKNRDGVLSASEISQGKLLGSMSTNDLIGEMQQADLDGDGTIDFNEFKRMMASVVKI